MSDLSDVAKQRIYEYQLALRGGTQEEVDDAAERLRALDLDPEIARGVRLTPGELAGDR